MRNYTEIEKLEIEQMLSKCLDSPGYLIFAAHLSVDRGRIEYQYKRHHFAFEDAKQALETLKKFVENEIKQLIDSYADNGGGNDAESD